MVSAETQGGNTTTILTASLQNTFHQKTQITSCLEGKKKLNWIKIIDLLLVMKISWKRNQEIVTSVSKCKMLIQHLLVIIVELKLRATTKVLSPYTSRSFSIGTVHCLS